MEDSDLDPAPTLYDSGSENKKLLLDLKTKQAKLMSGRRAKGDRYRDEVLLHFSLNSFLVGSR